MEWKGGHLRELALLDELDEVLVGRDGRRARRQAEYERLLCCGLEVVDPSISPDEGRSGVEL